MSIQCRLAPLVAATVFASCSFDSTGPITELPRNLSSDEIRLIEIGNRFAWSLFRGIGDQQPDQNYSISPLSVAMLLGMSYNGASGGTRDSIGRTLGLEDLSTEEMNEAYRSLADLLLRLDPHIEWRLANAVWHRSDFALKRLFIDVMQKYFRAEVGGLDFWNAEASQTINDWVREATDGRIATVVGESLPSDLVTLLLNAIYFKADWTNAFDATMTRDATFTLMDGRAVQVPTMSHSRGFDLRIYSDDMLRAVELPYGGNAFSMTLMVPSDGEDVHELAGALDSSRWRSIREGLDARRIAVTMPLFAMEYHVDLVPVLTALGMGLAFRSGGDFSNMSSSQDLFLNSVEHKTFVKVNEEGTEAGAATSGQLSVTDEGTQLFVVEEPFVFVISERFSGTIVFMGKVMNPQL